MSYGNPPQTRRHTLDVMTKRFEQKFDKVQHITPSDLNKKMSSSPPIILVDVRTDAEIQVSRIPKAITKQEFLSRNITPDNVVCAYCTVGYRSSKFAQQLSREPESFRQVYNLSGGILQWTHAGLPLVKAVDSHGNASLTFEETKQVHVFGKDFELQREDYEAVLFQQPIASYTVHTIKSTLSRWFSRPPL